MWPDSFFRRGGHGSKGADSYHAGFADFYHRVAGAGI